MTIIFSKEKFVFSWSVKNRDMVSYNRKEKEKMKNELRQEKSDREMYQDIVMKLNDQDDDDGEGDDGLGNIFKN